MNKLLLSLFAVIALMGIINATVIEPAICLSHEDAAVHQESEECCSACHPAHHQSLLPSFTSPDFSIAGTIDSVSALRLSLSDSPARSIFHPPLAS